MTLLLSPVAGGGPVCISVCPKFLFRFLLGVPRSNKKSKVDILYPGNFLDNDVISCTHIFSRNPRTCFQIAVICAVEI